MYASNLSSCVDVNGRKISGFKSHDCHVIMRDLFSVAIRNLLPADVSSAIVELCQFFRDIYAKVLVKHNYFATVSFSQTFLFYARKKIQFCETYLYLCSTSLIKQRIYCLLLINIEDQENQYLLLRCLA